MKQNQYSRRTNEIAREKLANILLFEISDPDLQLVTVTGCEVSVDKSFMRVFISCEPDRYEVVTAACKRAKGRIRTLLGHALKWRILSLRLIRQPMKQSVLHVRLSRSLLLLK